MLDVARRKPHGSEIEWVQSASQTFKSEKRYDLIIMTGHAFQVLLSDEDVSAAMRVMVQHSKNDGLIVFESRNPNFDWSADWNYTMDFDTPFGRLRESRQLISMDGEFMVFELHYEFPDEKLVSHCKLRFLTCEQILEFASDAGLVVDTIYGGWHGEPLSPYGSDEMVFQFRPRSCTR